MAKLRAIAVEERIERGGTTAAITYLETAPKEFENVREVGRWLHKEQYYPSGANYYCQQPIETSQGSTTKKCQIVEGMGEETYLDLREYIEAIYNGRGAEYEKHRPLTH